jgi:hypothetical protein
VTLRTPGACGRGNDRNGGPELKSTPGWRSGRRGQRAAFGGDNGQDGDAPKVANRPI